MVYCVEILSFELVQEELLTTKKGISCCTDIGRCVNTLYTRFVKLANFKNGLINKNLYSSSFHDSMNHSASLR
ncbi:MAG: hypothetical protein RI894_1503 [Bacteroidota bacterium]|jgi:hypothetical protein